MGFCTRQRTLYDADGIANVPINGRIASYFRRLCQRHAPSGAWLAVAAGTNGRGVAFQAYFNRSFTASRPACAQAPSCSADAPLTPTAPICSPLAILIGRPPSKVTTPGT